MCLIVSYHCKPHSYPPHILPRVVGESDVRHILENERDHLFPDKADGSPDSSTHLSSSDDSQDDFNDGYSAALQQWRLNTRGAILLKTHYRRRCGTTRIKRNTVSIYPKPLLVTNKWV